MAETTEQARMIAKDFLEASMIPDPAKAASFLADDATIFFTSGTLMTNPREMAAYNASRYKWVKKKLGIFDVAIADDCVVVYSVGTLFGEWPNGTPFEGNRYIDRFEIRNQKITRIDVWNDSAERILSASA